MAGGTTYQRVNNLLNVPNHACHIPLRHIARDDNLPLDLLAAYCIRAGVLDDSRQFCERDSCSAWCIHEQVSNVVSWPSTALSQLHDQIETVLSIQYSGHFRALHGGL